VPTSSNAQDISSGNPGEDTVLGDGGEDSIDANDGLSDTIDCGDNLHDVDYYDAGLDEISNREFQNPRGPTAAAKAEGMLSRGSR
jgi:hypothetical protein